MSVPLHPLHSSWHSLTLTQFTHTLCIYASNVLCVSVEAFQELEGHFVVYLDGVVEDSGWWRLALNVPVKQLAE